MTNIRETKYGQVEGFVENGIFKCFGIPFAKPPIGELRFKRAMEPEPWSNIKECKKMSPKPPNFFAKQIMKSKSSIKIESEDCLYLNVWSPEKTEKAPVFVWIYGGANHIGGTSEPEYDLESFANKGIVSVSFNYRVGPLGFYDFSKIDESFDSNCAISDMIRAMNWVHENISEFGGNPENVTICGQSTGGTGVYCLLSSPKAKGTFQKAIAMSGLPSNINTYKTHKLNNELYLKGLKLNKENISKLREMSLEELAVGTKSVFSNNRIYPGILIPGPVIDDLVPEKPWVALEKGAAKDIKCMFGTCKNEGELFYRLKIVPRSWSDLKAMLEYNNYLDYYNDFKKVYGHKKEKEAMNEVATDRMFLIDTMRCCLNQSKHNTVYSYRFDYQTGLEKILRLNCIHGTDICPALNTWKGAMSTIHKLTSKNRRMQIHDYIHGAFINFIKTGNPNGVVPIKWNPYSEDNKESFIFNNECSTVRNHREDVLELWKDLYLYQ